MSWLTDIQVWGAITGLLCVFLAARENVWSYPVGIINIIIFVFMFYDAKLYADVTLQGIFMILTIYGWVHWLRGPKNNKDVRKTSRLTLSQRLFLLVIVSALTAVLGSFYHYMTEAALPYQDSFILSASIVAQYLLSRKVLDTWIFWIMVNIVAVPVYWSRGLDITAVLYVVFLVNAIHGYIAWRKQMVQEETEEKTVLAFRRILAEQQNKEAK